MNKRETALRIITIEHATHGKATSASTRAYCENRIGADAYNKAAKVGRRQFEASHADQERR